MDPSYLVLRHFDRDSEANDRKIRKKVKSDGRTDKTNKTRDILNPPTDLLMDTPFHCVASFKKKFNTYQKKLVLCVCF